MKKTVAGGTTMGLGAIAGCAGDSGSTSNGGGGGGGDDTGGGGGGGNSGDSLTSMGSIANLKNSYWLSWKKGYEEAAAAFDFDQNLQTNDGQVSKQQQQFDTAIANNTDAIVGQTYTNAAAISLAETCVQAGVPTVLAVTIAKWYTPMDAGEEYTQFFTPHFVRHAYTAAKVLFEEMGGSGGFVHIEGNRGTAPNIGRNLGVQKALEEYPDIELLGPRLQGNWVRSDSRKAMSDLISKHGDKIEGFFGQNDAVAIGGLTMLEENDFDVPVVGIDSSEPGLELIEEGRLTGSVSGMGPWQAGWSMAKVYDYLQGHKLKPAERMMSFDSPLTVKDPGKWQDMIGDETQLPILDAAQYKKDIFEGETPYDWKKMSVAASGDDWDPQIRMEPIRKTDLKSLLDWEESNKPSGYTLHEVFDDEAAMDEVAQTYEQQLQNNPLK
ncbi:sugar ABC transporter substrate-binding protein [Haloarchaeobius sp. HME9146]|uniref:sugar ABC transporter substrate-binding protein n=1 Tax=Haloarchaeobius sp. HME9146 TaxID=2978732 RepID=UPI0021C1464E|nr:sugar ABC transporter substrate-binding protein [Haloarchaeobius sp. HME9146]MCT9098110.1 sugar ABC transporter substrate-binding protein [Haloarchaeobius sp. HME9146]